MQIEDLNFKKLVWGARGAFKITVNGSNGAGVRAARTIITRQIERYVFSFAFFVCR